VQLGLPFVRTESPPARGPVLLQHGDAAVTLHLVRMRSARRYVLRVRPDGTLRVTVPRGGSRAEALRFAERHLPWALRERAKLLAVPRTPSAWTAGTTILINGEDTLIVRDNGVARAGDIMVRVPQHTVDARSALERRMRAVARRQLGSELETLAVRHGLRVARVSIRNQRSRWGSCSRGGRIALNFRLIQMPPWVREYILLHELMHLRQPNHSRRFWSLVESVCPAFREAERWLKTHGKRLF
jgi:predicted metal-dependent hydrolase